MITEDLARQALAASEAAYDDDATIFHDSGTAFVRVGAPITDAQSGSPTGFNAVIFQKLSSPDEYIVAFTGTEDLPDAFADISLGTGQWSNNASEIFARIAQLGDVASLTFAGHSLGGALAQYAAYDFLDPNARPGSTDVDVSVVTFNGLSGREGIADMHGQVDPDRLAGVDGAHFADARDVVARLGGGHVGGEVIVHDFGSTDALGAHQLSTSFLAEANRGVPLIGGGASAALEYLPVSNGQAIAAIAANFLNVGGVSASEAALRSVAGGMMMLAFAPEEELNALGNAVFPEAGEFADWGRMRNDLDRSGLGLLRGEAALIGSAAIYASNVVQAVQEQIDTLETVALGTLEAADRVTRTAVELGRQAHELAIDSHERLVEGTSELIEEAAESYHELVRRVAEGMAQIVELYDRASDFAEESSDDAHELYEGALEWMGDQLRHLGEIAEGASGHRIEAVEAFMEDKLGRLAELRDLPGVDQAKALVTDALSQLSRVARGLEQLLPGPVGEMAGYLDDVIGRLDVAALTGISPLVLDLDRDGYELSPLSGSAVFFDLNANGFAERTGWVSADDGLLALDRNGNGRIDDGSELFGNHTPIAAGTASDGFAALADLDTDGNGTFDGNDAAFESVRVWRDLDGDGRSQPRELHTLGESGVASISLDAETSSQIVAGHALPLISTFTRENGTAGELADVFFQTNRIETRYLRPLSFAIETLSGPNLRGYGRVPDLQVAMSLDEGLEALVAEIRAMDFATLDDVEAALSRFDAVLERWTGAHTIEPGSRGSYVDARQLGVLEAFWDRRWTSQRTLSDQPGSGEVANKIHVGYEHLRRSLAGRFIAQLVSGAQSYDLGSDSLVNTPLVVAVNLHVRTGTAGDDVLIGDLYTVRNRLSGGAGDDILLGAALHDLLEGGDGNDVLLSGETSAEFHAGRGDDQMRGGRGDDEYFFAAGDGSDLIADRGGVDHVYLGPGIERESVRIGRQGLDLVIAFGDAGDRIRIEDWYASSIGRIETLHFDDGAVLDAAALTDLGAEAHGSEQGDTLTGLPKGLVRQNRLYGEGGDDTLYAAIGGDLLNGGAGDDTLVGVWVGTQYVGGPGSDRLQGTVYSDYYYFGPGDGSDVVDERGGVDHPSYADHLYLGEGIEGSDVHVAREGTDLVVAVGEGSDSVRVLDWYGSTRNRLEWVHFADGSTWDVNRLTELGAEVHGTAAGETLEGLRTGLSQNRLYGEGGDDLLYAARNGDWLDGGAGDDTLVGRGLGTHYVGGRGADSLEGTYYWDYYYYARGDGSDVVDERLGIPSERYHDHLYLGAGIEPADVGVVKEGSDLIVKIDQGSGSVRVLDWYASPRNRLEWVHFADGSAWDQEALNASGLQNLQLRGSPYADILSAPAAANGHLYGEAGNDVLAGGAGDDTLAGGPGDDALAGGLGDDTYLFARGDGSDRIADAGGGADSLQLANVSHDEIWLWREGADLALGVSGSADRVTVEGWYSDPGARLETVRAGGDGYVLIESQVAQLVSAMAAFEGGADRAALRDAGQEMDLSAALAAAWELS